MVPEKCKSLHIPHRKHGFWGAFHAFNGINVPSPGLCWPPSPGKEALQRQESGLSASADKPAPRPKPDKKYGEIMKTSPEISWGLHGIADPRRHGIYMISGLFAMGVDGIKQPSLCGQPASLLSKSLDPQLPAVWFTGEKTKEKQRQQEHLARIICCFEPSCQTKKHQRL